MIPEKEKRKLWLAILALAMVGANTPANGQNLRITGTVVDFVTSAPIPNAEVLLLGDGLFSTETRNDGTFTLLAQVAGQARDRAPKTRARPRLQGNRLTVDGAPANGMIRVEVYDGMGSRTYGKAQASDGGGFSTFSDLWKTPGFHFVKVSQGREGILPLAKPGAARTLTISKRGYYETKVVTAPSDTADLGTIRLLTVALAAPVLYRPDRILSPIDFTIVGRMQAIAARGADLRKTRFMKVGDANSHWNLPGFASCFNGTIDSLGTPSGFGWPINLDGRDSLTPTILYFRSEPISRPSIEFPETPYNRRSLSVLAESKAGDPLSGPSPTLLRELAASKAQFAIVMFGSNDIRGALPSNIESFEAGMRAIADTLMARGVIPIYTTMPHARSYPNAVPSFVAVARAIAQGRQFPLIDLNLATRPLTFQGLGDSALLGSKGLERECDFSESAGDLEFGMNTRNLITLQMLHRIKKSYIDGGPAPDADVPRLQGDGSSSTPFGIDSLPFVDMRDLRNGLGTSIGGYSCRSSLPMPEKGFIYRINLKKRTAIRILVLDALANAVSVSLRSSSGCLKHAPRLIETTVDAGIHHIAVEGNPAGAGAEYTLAVTECVAGDVACSP